MKIFLCGSLNILLPLCLFGAVGGPISGGVGGGLSSNQVYSIAVSAPVAYAVLSGTPTNATLTNAVGTLGNLAALGTSNNLSGVLITNGGIYAPGKFYGDGSQLTDLPGQTAVATLTNTAWDIRWSGATNNSADNSLAISNALWHASQSNWWCYVPPGRWTSGPVSLTANLFGAGTNSCLVLAAGNGALLTAASPGVSVRNLHLDGLSTAYFLSNTNVEGTRKGLVWDSGGICEVSGVYVSGFDSAGIELAGSGGAAQDANQGVLQNFWASNCFYAVTGRVGAAEYTRIQDGRIWRSQLAVGLNGANQSVSRIVATDCARFGILGTNPSDKRGHSYWTDLVGNHCTSGIFVRSNETGAVLSNIRFLGSDAGFDVRNSRGIDIHGCQFQGGGISVDSSGNAKSSAIMFHDNRSDSTIDMIDWGTSLIHYDNRTLAGVLSDGAGSPAYAPGGGGWTTNGTFYLRSGLEIGTNATPIRVVDRGTGDTVSVCVSNGVLVVY